MTEREHQQVQNKPAQVEDPADVKAIEKFGRKWDTAQVWFGSGMVGAGLVTLNPALAIAGGIGLATAPPDAVWKDRYTHWRRKKAQEKAARETQQINSQAMAQEAQQSRGLLRLLDPFKNRWNPQRSPQQLAQAA